MWIELTSETAAKLNRVARSERREPREQAAYFVERALLRAVAETERADTGKTPTAA
jgi:hypothetical protein